MIHSGGNLAPKHFRRRANLIPLPLILQSAAASTRVLCALGDTLSRAALESGLAEVHSAMVAAFALLA
jgi:hypothetical protein